MQYQIFGQDFQILNVWLEAEEKLISEAGAMVYMSGNVEMEAKAVGGLGGMLKRALMRESLFLTEYTAKGGRGFVALGRSLGKIVPLQLTEGQTIIAQKDAFLASTSNVDVDIHLVKRLGAGLFGGEGFILQKIVAKSPNQTVFLEASGQVIELNLQEGQVIKVDTGNLVAFDPTVNYDIERAGNIKTMLFGGEGLFIVKLTGPGRVWIQSINMRELIHSLGIYRVR